MLACESVTYTRANGVVVTRPGKPDNFDDMWMPEPNSGCWLWLRTLTNGYGYYRGRRAHRVSYERARGPIPDGLVIDHLCRNPYCVNPQHLEAVPQQINAARGNAGKWFRAAQLAKTYCPQGHEYAGRNLYVNPNTGVRHCRKCKAAHEAKRRMEAKRAL